MGLCPSESYLWVRRKSVSSLTVRGLIGSVERFSKCSHACNVRVVNASIFCYPQTADGLSVYLPLVTEAGHTLVTLFFDPCRFQLNHCAGFTAIWFGAAADATPCRILMLQFFQKWSQTGTRQCDSLFPFYFLPKCISNRGTIVFFTVFIIRFFCFISPPRMSWGRSLWCINVRLGDPPQSF